MVKFEPLLPALGLVTRIALIPKCAPVEIILFMTVNAKVASFSIFFVRFVTRRALLGDMFAFQREARVGMVKRIDLHIDDVGIPANVVRMTGVARLGARQRIQAVETLPGLPVRLNFIVAIEAEARQTGLVE